MWDFFNVRKVKARKAHRCDEAGCEIRPGDFYWYGFGKCEGEPMDQHLCLECDLISAEMMFAFDYDEGFPLGSCREELRTEHGIDEDPVVWATRHRAERLAKRTAALAREAEATANLVRQKSILGQIADERHRQVAVEGWSPAHDDAHGDGALALAAACYAAPEAVDFARYPIPTLGRRLRWPWDRSWWKPKDRRRDLIRAGALIVAEMERLDRQQAREAAHV